MGEVLGGMLAPAPEPGFFQQALWPARSSIAGGVQPPAQTSIMKRRGTEPYARWC